MPVFHACTAGLPGGLDYIMLVLKIEGKCQHAAFLCDHAPFTASLSCLKAFDYSHVQLDDMHGKVACNLRANTEGVLNTAPVLHGSPVTLRSDGQDDREAIQPCAPLRHI